MSTGFREFVFSPQERVVDGVGALHALPTAMAELKADRLLLVTGRTLSGSSWIAQIRELLSPQQMEVFSGAEAQTPIAAVRKAAEVARAYKPDALIALGGSSVVDCAKGVALLLSEGEPLEAHQVHFRYPDQLTVPSLHAPKVPIVAIPTTLSGSEFGPNIGITLADGRKATFIDQQLTPRIVILDPVISLETPLRLWLSTAVKVIDHAVERLLSRFAHPLSNALCLDALRMCVAALRQCATIPEDLDSRRSLQLASWLALVGHVNTSTGLNHALGHQLGGICNVPHGVAAGITLPHVLRFNEPYALKTLAKAARAVDPARFNLEDPTAVDEFIGQIVKLVRDLGLPQRLRDVGVPWKRLQEIAEAALGDRSAMANPRTVTHVDEVRGILETAW